MLMLRGQCCLQHQTLSTHAAPPLCQPKPFYTEVGQGEREWEWAGEGISGQVVGRSTGLLAQEGGILGQFSRLHSPNWTMCYPQICRSKEPIGETGASPHARAQMDMDIASAENCPAELFRVV